MALRASQEKIKMNQVEINNKRHAESLKVVERFLKAGGKITHAPDDYKGVEWVAPKPKRLVNPKKRV